jgi:deoxyribodipyrimidine photo-lyase
MSELPTANDKSVRSHEHFGKLFEETSIPDSLMGFELSEGSQVRECWPEGLDTAKELLQRFLHTKARKQQLQLISPLADGAEQDDKKSRLAEYQTGRNLVNGDHSSRLSPYLASGVISARMVLNEAKKMGKGGKLESGRDTGVGMWVQEVAWRDFYNHVSFISV